MMVKEKTFQEKADKLIEFCEQQIFDLDEYLKLKDKNENLNNPENKEDELIE